MKMRCKTWLSVVGILAGASAVWAQDARIIRFEPNGEPGGLVGNDRDKSSVYYYYKSRADERVVEDKNGRETTFTTGDAVLIPRGTEFSWKRTVDEKEYWVIFDRESPGTPAPKEPPTFFRLERDGPAGEGLTGSGRTREHEYYSGADGSSVGVWETQPYTATSFHMTKYAELMIVLKGSATLTTPAGQVERFKTGDVALVPRGIEYKWSSDTVRKFWVIFDSVPAGPTALDK